MGAGIFCSHVSLVGCCRVANQSHRRDSIVNSNSIQSRTGAGTQEQTWFEYDGHAGGWLGLKAKVSFRGEYRRACLLKP